MVETVIGCSAPRRRRLAASDSLRSGSACFHAPIEVDRGEIAHRRDRQLVIGAEDLALEFDDVEEGRLEDRMVGVTTNDDYPAEVKKVEKVGDMKIDTEKVLSLKPDLVLASEGLNGKETVDKLRKLGLTVIAYEPENLEGVFQQIQDVGKATGAGKKSDELISKMKKEEQQAKKIAAKVPSGQTGQGMDRSLFRSIYCRRGHFHG